MWQGYIKTFRNFFWLLLVAPLICLAVQKDLFVEGQDYVKLPETMRKNKYVEQLLMSDPHKVQILFFFSFACHGCEVLHTPFTEWVTQQQKNPNNKTVIHIYPVSFNAQWQMLAKMYYVMEALDLNKNLSTAVFTAIHKNGIKLWEPAVMKKFFTQHGVAAEQFDAAYNAFGVKMQANRADELSKAYGIVITPNIIVNGPVHSYKLDLAKTNNDVQKLIKVLNYLVARESKLL